MLLKFFVVIIFKGYFFMNNKTIFMKAALSCLGMIKKQSPMPRRFTFKGIGENMTSTYIRFFNELIVKSCDKQGLNLKTNINLQGDYSVSSSISYFEEDSETYVAEELTPEEKVAITNLTLLTNMCQVIQSIMTEDAFGPDMGAASARPSYTSETKTSNEHFLFDPEKIHLFIPRIRHYFPLTNFSDSFLTNLVEAILNDKARMSNVTTYGSLIRVNRFSIPVSRRFNIDKYCVYRNFDISKIKETNLEGIIDDDRNYTIEGISITAPNMTDNNDMTYFYTVHAKCYFTSQLELMFLDQNMSLNLVNINLINGKAEISYKSDPRIYYDNLDVNFDKELFCTLLLTAYTDCVRTLGATPEYINELQKLIYNRNFDEIYCLLWHNPNFYYHNRLVGLNFFSSDKNFDINIRTHKRIYFKCNKKTMVNPYLFKEATDKVISILNPEYRFLGELKNHDEK